MTKRKKILKKITRGMGSTYLSFVIMFLCFLMTIMSFEFYELYSSTIRLQMFSDIVSDGATVYAKKPITVNETELDFMAKTLIEENEARGVINVIAPHQEISLTALSISDINVREGAKDTLVSLAMENNVETVLGSFTQALFASIFGWRHSIETEVIALSTIPEEIQIKEADQAVFNAVLNKLQPGTKKYEAITRAIEYYGWGYSREHRWEEGARDCSSFVISSYEPLELFTNTEFSYTQTMWRDGISNNRLQIIESYPVDYRKLTIGDVIFFSTDWGVEAGRENGIGSCAIYLGEHSGTPKIYLADERIGRVCVQDLYGYTPSEGRTNNKIVGILRAGGAGSDDLLECAEYEYMINTPQNDRTGAKYWNFLFPGWTFVGGDQEQTPWCACFVCYVADQAGKLDSIVPRTAGCGAMVRGLRERGRFTSPLYTPSPGDIIFFDWDPLAGNGVDHVGYVQKVENGFVYTIEGNSGNRIAYRTYRLNSSVIFGYGMTGE